MTISYPLTLPTYFRNWTLSIEWDVSRMRSPFSGKEQLYAHSGGFWKLQISFPPLELDKMRDVQAFAASLAGGVGTFSFGDRNMTTPRGVATGTPVVNGGSQTGLGLNTSGWTAGQTNILRKGDFFQVGTNLHMVTKDVNSDGSGLASLDIFPRLRSSPSNGATIIISSPVGIFRPDTNEIGWSGGIEKAYDFSLTAVEAL